MLDKYPYYRRSKFRHNMDSCIEYHKIMSNVIWSNHLIVTEKIHGANLGIGFINNSLRIQSRRKIIDKNSNFMNFGSIIDQLISFVEQIKDILKCNFLVYGEIFGKGVQKEIEYNDSESPFKQGLYFRAFDIYRIDDRVYLKYSDAIELFERVGLPYIPILDIEYKTIGELYAKVETHKSDYSNQPVEGFVLKNNEEEPRKFRTIFKVKRTEFIEKGGLLNKCKPKNFVNRNRLVSAFTKIGDIWNDVEKEMITDALDDIMSIYNYEVKREVDRLILAFPDLDALKDLKIKKKKKNRSQVTKFDMADYVNRVKLHAVYTEKGTDLELVKEKMSKDALKEIEMFYRSQLATEVKKFMNKEYNYICKQSI